MLTAAGPAAVEFLPDLARSFTPALEDAPAHLSLSWQLQLDGARPPVSDVLALVREVLPPSVRLHVEAAGRQRGPAYTRTVGLLSALSREHADVVLTVDADDLWLPGAVSGFVSPLVHDDSLAWVAAGNTRFSAEEGVKGVYAPGGGLSGRVHAGGVRAAWVGGEHFPFAAGCAAFRPERILEFGGWPASPTGEDAALLLAVSDFYPGWAVEAPLFAYRSHREQSTRSPEHAHLRDLTRALMLHRRR